MPLRSSGQLPLLPRKDYLAEPDRNFDKGGRSFYFFDFDDNVIHLQTKIVLYHKRSGEELQVSTTEYALAHPLLGKSGSPWEDFTVRFDPAVETSFRNFREVPKETLGGRPQPLIADMLAALQHPFLEWRGPSWDFFVHAVNNNRPIAIITARGHHPHTIRRAINILVESRDLLANPNYLSVYPVSHPESRLHLGDSEQRWTTIELKKAAIKAAVADAFACYGENPHHRFGMSDDDPANIAVIREAMIELKKLYPENAFFVFNTHGRRLVREEVLLSGVKVDELESRQEKLL
jgi:hypothetical protein